MLHRLAMPIVLPLSTIDATGHFSSETIELKYCLQSNSCKNCSYEKEKKELSMWQLFLLWDVFKLKKLTLKGNSSFRIFVIFFINLMN